MIGRKPVGESVTTKPCTCDYLAQQAAEPDAPINRDPVTNEYYLSTRRRGQLVIRHCPWCGGVAPRSTGAHPFEALTWAEVRRLERLTAGVRSVTEAIARFGKPAEARRRGVTIRIPATKSAPETAESFPTFTFSELSKTADVTLVDYGARGVAFQYSPRAKRMRARPNNGLKLTKRGG